MTGSKSLRSNLSLRRVIVVALGCAFSCACVHLQASSTDVGGPRLLSMDNQIQVLPFTATFSKADGDNGPFGLTLRNTSGNSIRASASVSLNAGPNADGKVREIPGHVVDRAETWTIYGLSTGDRVTVQADGYSALNLTVP